MVLTKDDHGGVVDEASRVPSERPATEPSGGASIDKVRDILFGNQVREFERRFARLEDRMVKQTNDLEQQLTARVEALEAFTRNELESLADRIRAEHEDRVESQGGVLRDLKTAADSLERRTASLDEQLAKSQREIRQQILDQNQRLSDEIRRKADEVLAALTREAQELRTDKADRSTIAALLNEMAMRLAGDFPSAGPDDAGTE